MDFVLFDLLIDKDTDMRSERQKDDYILVILILKFTPRTANAFADGSVYLFCARLFMDLKFVINWFKDSKNF